MNFYWVYDSLQEPLGLLLGWILPVDGSCTTDEVGIGLTHGVSLLSEGLESGAELPKD